jgi:tetratricopeptide (TPR) repeat protein
MPAPQDAAKPDDKPAAPPQGLGEAPASLDEVEWVQGKSISQYKRGETYLIVFLSTGSQATPRMLREMVALQEAHAKDRLQIVGLFSKQSPQVEPPAGFMKRRPDAASLRIARDKSDATRKAWEKLIGKFGDQSAVLIDKKGKIAWHGGVFADLSAAIPAVLADDDATLTKLVDARRTIDESAKTQFDALNKAISAKSWDKVVTTADAILALDARAFAHVGVAKYKALVYSGKKAEASSYGKELVAGPLHDSEGDLNELAWWIVDPAGKLADNARDLEVAMAAAERSSELGSQQDAAVLDTLARVHWRLGHRDQALELQKKAVGLAFGSETKSALQKALDEYLKPPAPKPDVPAPGEAGAAPPAPTEPPAPPAPGPDSGGDAPKS